VLARGRENEAGEGETVVREREERGGKQGEIKGSSQFAIWTTLEGIFRRGDRHTLM